MTAALQPFGTTAEAVEQWAEGAKPGEKFVYFTGWSLPKQFPSVIAADRLHAAGLVTFVQSRRGDGMRDYEIRRLSAEYGAAPSQANRGAGRRIDDNPVGVVEVETERLMDVLKRLANFGRPCPSNAELARLAALDGGRDAVPYRLSRLSIANRITIEDQVQGPRVITILSSGKRTASSSAPNLASHGPKAVAG